MVSRVESAGQSRGSHCGVVQVGLWGLIVEGSEVWVDWKSAAWLGLQFVLYNQEPSQSRKLVA